MLARGFPAFQGRGDAGGGVSGATVQGQDLALRLAWEARVKGAGGARGLGEEEPPLKRAGERVRCAGEVSKGVGCGIGPVQRQAGTCHVLAGAGSFFFFIFKKNSKIYVRFEKFRKCPPVARPRGDRGPVAQATSDRTSI